MIREVIVERVGAVNNEALDAALRSAVAPYRGFSRRPKVDGLVLIFETPVDDTQIASAQSIVLSHDPTTRTPEQQMLGSIRATAQSAAGVALADLTPAQRNALMAAMLWKMGGITKDGTIRPIEEWIR